jgi:nicotinamide-nucleotide amidase
MVGSSDGQLIMSQPLQQLIQALLDRKQTVSLAESCTGGQLSALITENPGVSAIFKGSVVSYANEAKVELLGVGHDSLQRMGAVSEIVARQMAQGVCHRFHTDWGVSITGVAGPSGGSQEKPVGTVWMAVAGPKLESSQKNKLETHNDLAEIKEVKKYLFDGDRKQIQSQSVNAAVNLLLTAIRASASK